MSRLPKVVWRNSTMNLDPQFYIHRQLPKSHPSLMRAQQSTVNYTSQSTIAPPNIIPLGLLQPQQPHQAF